MALLTDNLLAYYKFDESSGDASDSTANAKTLTNTNTVPYVTGKLNNGIDIEESTGNQFFQRTNSAYYDVTSGSISIWMNLESVTHASKDFTAVDCCTGSGAGGFVLKFNHTTGVLYFTFGTETNKASTSALSIATWYHIVATWNTSRKEIFVNGVSVGANETDETMTAGGTNFRVGTDFNNVSNFDGIIDELGIWSRVLTQTEITNLYNSGTPLAYANLNTIYATIIDTSGTPTEVLAFTTTQPITILDTAGTPTEAVRVGYSFSNTTKTSATVTNTRRT
jgi:hypothetical protein